MSQSIRRPRAALILLALIALFASLALVAPRAALAQPESPGSGDSGSSRISPGLSPEAQALVKGSGPEAEAEAVKQFWTPERMKAAKPLDQVLPAAPAPSAAAAPVAAGAPGQVEPAAPGSAPEAHSFVPDFPASHFVARTYGKVFISVPGGLGFCSATIVNSPRRDTVWTAAHCLHSGGPNGIFFNDWLFVPAYEDGVAPYGGWRVIDGALRTRWTTHMDWAEDLAVLVVAPNNGRHIVDALGGQGLAWNFPKSYDAYSFGYPVDPPFDGERLIGCRAITSAFEQQFIALPCNMTPGSSGGGWLRSANHLGQGYLNGVNSHGIEGFDDIMFSPYYGEAVPSLYNYVVNEL